MRSALRFRFALAALCFGLVSAPIQGAIAQTAQPTAAATADTQLYHSDTFGVSFQYPVGWTLHEQPATQTVTLSSSADDQALQNGKPPSGLIFSLTFTSFRQVNAAQISDFAPRLVQLSGEPPEQNPTPKALHLGSSDGLSLDVLDTNAGVAGSSAMLSIGQRRVAVVRGIATIHAWVDGGAQQQYETIINSLSFFAPANSVNQDQIGRVLWQATDSRFSTFADMDTSADGTSVYATDPKQGIWTLNANGIVGDLKTYDGVGAYGGLVQFRDGTRYITDPATHQVWIIAANNPPKKIAGGIVGTKRGQFGANSPNALTVGYSSTLNVLDVNDQGSRIEVFDRGGDPLADWPIDSVQGGKLAADPDGYLYIVGSNLAGVAKYVPSGKPAVKDLGKAAINGAVMTAVAVDRFGNIYVATADSGIIKLDAQGNLLGVIGQPYDGSTPPKPGQLAQPTALALGNDGQIVYVADSGKYPQIVAFTLVNDQTLDLTAGTAAMGTITYGQTVNGTITAEKFVNSYTFTATHNDVITITMRAAPGSKLDPFVDLLGSDGSRLAGNDDAPSSAGLGSLDAQIATFKIPYDGKYTINASRFGREMVGASIGDYTLTLDKQ